VPFPTLTILMLGHDSDAHVLGSILVVASAETCCLQVDGGDRRYSDGSRELL